MENADDYVIWYRSTFPILTAIFKLFLYGPLFDSEHDFFVAIYKILY